jgi:hypothetical protein
MNPISTVVVTVGVFPDLQAPAVVQYAKMYYTTIALQFILFPFSHNYWREFFKMQRGVVFCRRTRHGHVHNHQSSLFFVQYRHIAILYIVITSCHYEAEVMVESCHSERQTEHILP